MLEAFFTYITKDGTNSKEINKEVDNAIGDMDLNKDGMVSFEEFLKYNLKMNGLVYTSN
jgi:Ca2+-binding EF-hand superfamily protein